MFNRSFHHIINNFAGKKAVSFNQGDLKHSQLMILQRLIRESSKTQWGKSKGFHQSMSYDEFSQIMPPTKWDDWEMLVTNQMGLGQNIISTNTKMYQPTSGSTFKRKWIPYTKSFLAELNSALMVWMFDLYRQYPGIRKGKHYWSLSWLPEDLRASINNDDLKLMGKFQELLLRPLMAVPAKVQHSPTVEESTLLTLTHLIQSRDLSFISVWSPIFLLSLLHILQEERILLSQRVSDKKIKEILLGKNTLSELCHHLWPHLVVISCWDSAESAPWAEEIKKIFPRVALQGKGLMATEGIVTFPFEKQQVLAYQSHFYEFLSHGKILPSWELKPGMIVEPLLTTGSGLFRYHLPDKLEVTKNLRGIPTMKFLGRQGGVDLAGEKMDREMIREYFQILGQLCSETSPVTMLAVQNRSGVPGYCLIVKKKNPHIDYEFHLMTIHHYRLARELHQLKPLEVYEMGEEKGFWRKLAIKRSMIEGDQKADILIRVATWD